LGLRNISYLQVVNAQVGKNASGDIFFTDGRAVVVDLQSKSTHLAKPISISHYSQ